MLKKNIYKLLTKNKDIKDYIQLRRINKTIHKISKISPVILNFEGSNISIFHDKSEDHLSIIKSIFLDKSYSVDFCIQGRNILKKEKYKEKQKLLIVDLGAHIGISMLYFISKFPNSTILGVEPNKKSLENLYRNLSKWINKNVFVYEGLIGNEDNCEIPIYENNNGSWSVSEVNYTKQKTPIDIVNKFTLPTILKGFNENEFFILKIDIEGSEKELFSTRTNWEILDKFQVVIVELHDWMLPAENTAAPIFIWANEFKRDILIRGVNVFLFKQS